MEFEPNSLVRTTWEPGLCSLGIYLISVVFIVGSILFLSGWLGERRPNPEKARPYECGIIPTGEARIRFPVAFYLVAAFFLIFDVEAAYIFAWAVAFDRLGWAGWLHISFFIVLLMLGLFYIWKKGGLEWNPKPRRSPVTRETSSLPSSTR